MSDMPGLFAEVAVNSTLPHRQTFSYAVPEGMDVSVGHAVYVPFGRRTLQGIVLEVHGTPVYSEPEKIRPLLSTIGNQPLLDAPQVELARWIAHEYLAPIFDCVALMLPPGFERRPQTIARPLVERDEIDGLEIPDRQRMTLRALVEAGGLEIDALRDRLGFAPESALGQLERRGLAARDYTLARPRITGKLIEVVSLALPGEEALAAINRAEPPKHSRRAAVLERLLEKRGISEDEARRLAGSGANLQRLVRSGLVRYDREGHDVELALAPDEALSEIQQLRRTARASQAIRALECISDGGAASLRDLRDAGADVATVRWMASIGVLRLAGRPVERDPLAHFEVERRGPPVLLSAQQEAVDAICAALVRRPDAGHGPGAFLLHGVTGSGKTEVYLAALDACVAARGRGIVLVPEIALTPQTVRRFRERFERVAVLHSGLSDGELFDQWHGVAAGRYDVAIGSRSALFAPQPDLQLIVIDEEHEWTYKQHDASPRYHAREVARELARLRNATLVLGSATPDVVSYEAAHRGAYRLLELPERIRPLPGDDGVARPESTPMMPGVSIVDMREELHAGNRSMFSAELRDRVERAIAAREQAILFLNRRGLAGHVQCRDCGFVPECSSCFVALTYHRQYDRLVCHQCNRQSRLPAVCRQCGSPRVRLVGAGVEKVEAEAARLFPHARLLRWDRDVTRGRHAHERILETFARREADILIGTQMLAKGLDLPAVTVVGAISADIGLHLPDFRAGERTFQLLTQVAGRAGRGERPGHVVIQTYQPEHYAIVAASRHDYEGFAATELESRRRAGYPPFARLARLAFSHTNPRFAREEALRMHKALTLRRAEQGSDAEVLGPSPAYVPRLRGRWRWQLLLRGSDPASLVRGFLMPQGWTVDVDPVTLT